MRWRLKNHFINLALGLAHLLLTIYLFQKQNSIQTIFISTAGLSFILSYTRGAKVKDKFSIQLMYLNGVFLIFLLLGMNVWHFLFLPLAAFGMGAIGLMMRNEKISSKVKALLLSTSLLVSVLCYWEVIPLFVDFSMRLSYDTYEIKKIPEFEVVNLKMENITSSQFDDKILIIGFWVTWCSPCLSQFEEMKEVYSKYVENPDIVFLFVSNESIGEIKKFANRSGFDFPFVSGADDKVNEKFKVLALPFVLVVKDQQIKYIHGGYMPGQNLKDKIISEVNYLM